jgi:nitrogen regulatory protein P-II 1
MKQIKAIIQPFKLPRVCEALESIEGLSGITVPEVMGWGKAKAVGAQETVLNRGCLSAQKLKVEIVVPGAMADEVGTALADTARTGNVGDGKIFFTDLSDVVKIRTGEHGEAGF